MVFDFKPKSKRWIIRTFQGDSFTDNSIEILERDKNGGWMELETRCQGSKSGVRFTGYRAPTDEAALNQKLEDEIQAVTNLGGVVTTPVHPVKYSDLIRRWEEKGLLPSKSSSTAPGSSNAPPTSGSSSTSATIESSTTSEVSTEAQASYSVMASDTIARLQALAAEGNEEGKTPEVSEDVLYGYDSDGNSIPPSPKRARKTISFPNEESSKETTPEDPRDKQIATLVNDNRRLEAINTQLKEKNLKLESSNAEGSISNSEETVKKLQPFIKNELSGLQNAINFTVSRTMDEKIKPYKQDVVNLNTLVGQVDCMTTNNNHMLTTINSTANNNSAMLSALNARIAVLEEKTNPIPDYMKWSRTQMSLLAASNIEMVKAAQKLEPPSPIANRAPAGSSTPKPSTITRPPPPLCFYCGGPHNWGHCQSRPKDYFCYRCMEVSHMVNNCPKISHKCLVCLSIGHGESVHRTTNKNARQKIMENLGIGPFKSWL